MTIGGFRDFKEQSTVGKRHKANNNNKNTENIYNNQKIQEQIQNSEYVRKDCCIKGSIDEASNFLSNQYQFFL